MPSDIYQEEHRIDDMIAQGLRIVREVTDAYRPVAIVAAYSSGDDSIVSTHFAMEHIPGCFVFNADTLIGLEPSRCHLRSVCERFGWPLEVGRAEVEGPPRRMRRDGRMISFDPGILLAGRWTDGATAYEEFCLNFGFPGRGKPQHARMYQRLKERPIRRMLRRFGAGRSVRRPNVLLISGIRGDESTIRAGYKRAVSEGYFGDVWVNPFYWRSAVDFELYRQEFGLPCNPVKRLCGISGECCCGTFAGGASADSAAERAAYRVVDAEFEVYLSDLERRVCSNGFPWGWGQSPPGWWKDQRRGQGLLFDFSDEAVQSFQPMCVGCMMSKR
jgi:3'-phosphoadenosine 5'-phosphosulfate sulfotransferase (PAPS reductase)/FAD synthetase